MNLGKEVGTRFMVLFAIGIFTIPVSLVLAVLPGSPYALMGPAFLWVGTHFVAGTVMAVSAMFGMLASQVTEAHVAWVKHVKPAIAFLAVPSLFLLYSVWHVVQVIDENALAGKPVPSSIINLFGTLLVGLAFLTAWLAFRYLWRVYRLGRPRDEE